MQDILLIINFKTVTLKLIAFARESEVKTDQFRGKNDTLTSIKLILAVFGIE